MALTSPGFSTMTIDRPPLNKSASDSNLGTQPEGGAGHVRSDSRSVSDFSESPDLNTEVAALSNKLISAINHQTKLDDSLSAAKHELEISQARIRELERANKEHAEKVAKGLLVEKSVVEAERKKLLDRLSEESMQRGQAEKDKRNIEQELENLTTALFDEANKMVSAARRERDSIDRKNEQLRAQLADTESLLASHQEQLAELKAVMQQMTAERAETESRLSMSLGSTPPTPSLGHRGSRDSIGNVLETFHLAPTAADIDSIPPCPPTSLTNLLHPSLRHDIAAYNEFLEVLHTPKLRPTTGHMSRLSGGSFSSLQVMGMVTSLSTPAAPASAGGGLFSKRRSDASSVHHSPSNSINDLNSLHQQMVAALKETKFYKRTLVEDIEPTLRLETAPGLSWLARRNVQAAITDGSLVIDPMPSSLTPPIPPACALCGESRNDDQHIRTHRMRISESDTAQRYPLCGYCVNRVRSVCDFLSFLKTLKEGLWKCETAADERHAWEESVKLRERMFWARMGGGVVPAFHPRDRQNSTVAQSTPPRTPVEGEKLCIPKRRSQRNSQPFLTPERRPDEPAVHPSPLNISDEPVEDGLVSPRNVTGISRDVPPELIQCPPSPVDSEREEREQPAQRQGVDNPHLKVSGVDEGDAESVIRYERRPSEAPTTAGSVDEEHKVPGGW